MSTDRHWRLKGKGSGAVWELCDSDRVLEKVTHDHVANQYRDSRGELLGSDWVAARNKVEARAAQPQRNGIAR